MDDISHSLTGAMMKRSSVFFHHLSRLKIISGLCIILCIMLCIMCVRVENKQQIEVKSTVRKINGTDRPINLVEQVEGDSRKGTQTLRRPFCGCLPFMTKSPSYSCLEITSMHCS